MSTNRELKLYLPESVTLPISTSTSLRTDVESSKKEENQGKIYGKDLNTGDLLFSAHAERVIFDTIVEAYGLSGITSLESPKSISTTSRKRIITCDQGRFFLKEKARYCCAPEALTLSAAFQTHLSNETDLVPKIIHTLEGDPYCVIGTKVFLMTEYREGRLFRGNIEDIENAGLALAKLHISALDFSYSVNPALRSSLDDAHTFIDMADNLPNAIDDPYREQAISFLRDTISRRQSETISVPILVNHGDYAPFNLVFSNGVVNAINDFDNCNPFVRVRDLADPIITFCDGVNYAGATSSFRRPISRKFNLEKARTFIKSYCQTAGNLLPREKDVLVTEVLNRWSELMALGIVRGDFSYYDILQAREFPNFVEQELPLLLGEL